MNPGVEEMELINARMAVVATENVAMPEILAILWDILSAQEVNRLLENAVVHRE